MSIMSIVSIESIMRKICVGTRRGAGLNEPSPRVEFWDRVGEELAGYGEAEVKMALLRKLLLCILTSCDLYVLLIRFVQPIDNIRNVVSDMLRHSREVQPNRSNLLYHESVVTNSICELCISAEIRRAETDFDFVHRLGYADVGEQLRLFGVSPQLMTPISKRSEDIIEFAEIERADGNGLAVVLMMIQTKSEDAIWMPPFEPQQIHQINWDIFLRHADLFMVQKNRHMPQKHRIQIPHLTSVPKTR
ncbi:hypothetical protein K505DRAFT_359250 [Melanomma pulvis-pyrius CBS 109.77]|uniref:Uncharacterized protein n=1 Tax=Melanomma pulvis-pyrius CBS 109.77 TaxID=1314802 RepID=A0A6A6XJ31_9PLEO|nr:hypothetical protein K505DRAFT_359250 [Melanomma pulvis-pyrius CBS 109.77]